MLCIPPPPNRMLLSTVHLSVAHQRPDVAPVDSHTTSAIFPIRGLFKGSTLWNVLLSQVQFYKIFASILGEYIGIQQHLRIVHGYVYAFKATTTWRLGSYLNYIYIVSFTSLARFLWMMKFAGGHLNNGMWWLLPRFWENAVVSHTELYLALGNEIH